jgi:hypothetical protein
MNIGGLTNSGLNTSHNPLTQQLKLTDNILDNPSKKNLTTKDKTSQLNLKIKSAISNITNFNNQNTILHIVKKNLTDDTTASIQYKIDSSKILLQKIRENNLNANKQVQEHIQAIQELLQNTKSIDKLDTKQELKNNLTNIIDNIDKTQSIITLKIDKQSEVLTPIQIKDKNEFKDKQIKDFSYQKNIFENSVNSNITQRELLWLLR